MDEPTEPEPDIESGSTTAHGGAVDDGGLARMMAEPPIPENLDEVAAAVEASATNAAANGDASLALEDIAPVGWQAPLVDFLAAMVRRIWLVLTCVVLGASVGVVKLATTKPYYKSACVALLLPREKPGLDVSVSTGSLETGMDSAKRETTGALMLPPDTDLYTTILMSRSVILAVAETFAEQLERLELVPERDRSEEVVDAIKSMLKISGTDEGMMTIEVTCIDAELAADLANEFMSEMERASKAIERQLIVQQSGFLSGAETKVGQQLATDERALAEFYAEHGVVDLTSQAADILRMIREQKQAMSSLEHDRMERLTGYTEDDETVVMMDQRIAKHRADIERLRNSYLDVVSQEGFGQVRIQYEGLRDRVGYKRDLLATISTQRSVFDIRAEQPAGSVAVLKSAVAPHRPAGPSRKLTIGLPLIASILLACVLVLVLEQWGGSRSDPYIARRMTEIRASLASQIPRFVRRGFGWRRHPGRRRRGF